MIRVNLLAHGARRRAGARVVAAGEQRSALDRPRHAARDRRSASAAGGGTCVSEQRAARTRASPTAEVELVRLKDAAKLVDKATRAQEPSSPSGSR